MKKTYTGMVALSYHTDSGLPMKKYVMAFHNTAKELKDTFLVPKTKATIKLIGG